MPLSFSFSSHYFDAALNLKYTVGTVADYAFVCFCLSFKEKPDRAFDIYRYGAIAAFQYGVVCICFGQYVPGQGLYFKALSRPPMNGAICLKRMIPSPIMIAINEYFQYCSFVLIKFLYFLVKKHKRS